VAVDILSYLSSISDSANIFPSILTSIGEIIKSIISFPAVALLVIILWGKNIKSLLKELEKNINQGTVHALSVSGVNIEFNEAAFNNPQIIGAISIDSNEDLDFLRKRKQVLEVDLSKIQTIANLYFSIKHLYKFKGLKFLVFTTEFGVLLRTMEVEEFLAVFEQKCPIYSQAYERAYAKILISLANIPDEKLDESLSCGEHDLVNKRKDILVPSQSFNKYKEILAKSGINLKEEFTTHNLKEISKKSDTVINQILNLKEGKCNKCISAQDLFEVLNFESDYIPVIVQGQYRGVVTKSYIVQSVIENMLKEENTES
jgi:hypothetical protein